MPSEKGLRAIDRWLGSDPTRPERLRRWTKNCYHRFCWPHGERRTLSHAALYIAEAAVPAIALVANGLLSDTSKPKVYLTLAAAVAVFALFIGVVRRRVNAPKRDQHAREMFRRASEILVKHRTKNADKSEVKQGCLTMLEAYVRSAYRLPPGTVGVSIVTYKGDREKLKIDAREAGSKRRPGDFRCEFVLGHYAAQAGPDPRPIPDLHEFPKEFRKSPSGSDVAYRSIFIIPLGETVDEVFTPKGYISIDATQPYVFYGNRAEDMAVDCEHIADFMKTLI